MSKPPFQVATPILWRRLPDLEVFVTVLSALSRLLCAPVVFPLSPLHVDEFISGSNAAK